MCVYVLQITSFHIIIIIIFFYKHYLPVRQANWCNMTFTHFTLFSAPGCHSFDVVGL